MAGARDKLLGLGNDLLIFLAFAGGLGALWFLCFQGRIYGNDGAWLADWTFAPETATPSYHNPLFLRCAWWLSSIWPEGRHPLEPLQALCAGAGGVGVACSFATARVLGVVRARAVFGALFLAALPALTFFATCYEVHTLHFAMAAAAAFLTCALPWRKPFLAAPFAALFLGATYLTHQAAPILGPGFLALTLARRTTLLDRDDRSLELKEGLVHVFGVGAILLLGLVLGMCTNAWMRGLGFGLVTELSGETVDFWKQPFTTDIFWTGILQPTLLAFPLGVWAVLRSGERFEAVAFAVVFLPLCGAIVWWGIPERGGYLLGPAFLFATALGRLQWPARVLVGLLAIQAGFAAYATWSHDREGMQLDERVQQIAPALEEFGPSRTLVLSFNDQAPTLQIDLPEVKEFNLGRGPWEDWRKLEPEVFVQTWIQLMQGQAQQLGLKRFVFDLSYTRRPELRQHPDTPYVDALVEALPGVFDAERVEHPDWPILLLDVR